MPITSDHLENEPWGEKLKTVSGDRRLVRVNKSQQTLTRPAMFAATRSTEQGSMDCATSGATSIF